MNNMAKLALFAGVAAGAYLILSDTTMVEDMSDMMYDTQKTMKRKIKQCC